MSTQTTLALIGGCAVITAILKGAGPLTLGGRALPPWFSAVVALMAREEAAAALRAAFAPQKVA